jgi:hypothetical protein
MLSIDPTSCVTDAFRQIRTSERFQVLLGAKYVHPRQIYQIPRREYSILQQASDRTVFVRFSSNFLKTSSLGSALLNKVRKFSIEEPPLCDTPLMKHIAACYCEITATLLKLFKF